MLKVDIHMDADPITFVRLLLTDELICNIKDSTNNAYTAGVIDASRLLRRQSILNECSPTEHQLRKCFWHSIAYGTGWHVSLDETMTHFFHQYIKITCLSMALSTTSYVPMIDVFFGRQSIVVSRMKIVKVLVKQQR